ncbi:hypothetical protein TRFO_30180 [Tritrichomonas foetus]|uniref:Uncharacterized protein n=1 Tax=Tritrichomonas foetus TaxID=1144522 RepID=A0A1J4JU69_9EUKA|nr:hypothetical protein TRFO_30180 [Tritrichomonas foetus]|eukprot:OHT02681.1 hypothetical protein TRFO_30180 [Tritrichomonas foetus]
MRKPRVPIENGVTRYLKEHKGAESNVITELFIHQDIVSSIRNEVPELLDYVNENIEQLLEFALVDVNGGHNRIMAARNISTAFSGTSQALKKQLINNGQFKKYMVNYIHQQKFCPTGSIHWGKIMSSFAIRQEFMFFNDDSLPEIIDVLIDRIDLNGFQDLLTNLLCQNLKSYNCKITKDQIFMKIAVTAADWMREYKEYKKTQNKCNNSNSEKMKMIEVVQNDSEEDGGEDHKEFMEKLFVKVHKLLSVVSAVYNDLNELDFSDENLFQIIYNITEATLAYLDQKTVFNTGIHSLTLILKCHPMIDTIYDSRSPETPPVSYLTVQKYLKNRGKRFYRELGLYDMKIKPNMSLDSDNIHTILHSFPVFWAAGMKKLAPLIFRTEGYLPSRFGITMMSKLMNMSENYPAKFKIFIKENKIIQRLMKHLPPIPNTEEDKNIPVTSLNPFMLQLAEFISIKTELTLYDFVDGECDITFKKVKSVMLDIQDKDLADRFSKFICEHVGKYNNLVSEMVYEINKI